VRDGLPDHWRESYVRETKQVNEGGGVGGRLEESLLKNRHYAQNPSMSEMAFHEKAGPCQVDFDLPFLKPPFPMKSSRSTGPRGLALSEF
jgi:hypothetical protein